MKIIWIVFWTVTAFIPKPCNNTYPEDAYGVPRNYEYANLCGEYSTKDHTKVFESSTAAYAFANGTNRFGSISNVRIVESSETVKP